MGLISPNDNLILYSLYQGHSQVHMNTDPKLIQLSGYSEKY